MTQQHETDSAGGPGRLSVTKVGAWIEAAQPGARLVYFHGVFAGHGSEAVNDLLRGEAARGMVFLVQDWRARDVDGHDYVAIRSSRPAGQPLKGRIAAPLSMAEQARVEGERAFRSSGQ